MKALLLILLLGCTSLTMAEEINVKVNGMVCSLCAQGIKKKFSQVNEVKDIKVNLDDKLVQIQTQEGQDIEDGKITEIIKEAGYNVASIERK